jgi:hypothetical protein
MHALRLHTRSWQLAIAVLISGMTALLAGQAQANAIERLFAPRAESWPFWDSSNGDSTAVVDHGRWDRFLKTYTVAGDDGINRVQYAGVSSADRQHLEQYIDDLQQLPIRDYNAAQQLAYWINLYNALTVQLVLQHYPVDSIRDIDISPGFFADGPWGKPLLNIEGQALSLNDIEHRILRPRWQDPRLHYALNCASLGCPNLQPAAFRAATMDAMLEQAAAAYVNHPRGASLEDEGLTVSSIYSWFRDDFGDDSAAVIAHLQRYADPPLRDALSATTRISGYRYDWALNDAP